MTTSLRITNIEKLDGMPRVKILIQTSLPTKGSRGTGLTQNLVLAKNQDSLWEASIEFDEFPCKDTPEDAAQRLSEWLLALSKAVKGKNIKAFKIDELFSSKHFK